jgi:hypothetical protein
MIMRIPASFILIIVFFDEAFKYDDCAKFWGYVGTNAEPVCVEFCNFMQCHTFCEVFKLLLFTLIQLFYNWHDNGIILKLPILFRGGQKYLQCIPHKFTLTETYFL